MGEGRAARQQVRRFVLQTGILLTALLIVLAQTPLGHWIIEDFHGIDGSLAQTVRTAMLWLAPYPLIRGLSLYHTGLLIRHRRTSLVSYAMITSMGCSILTVFLALPLPWVVAQPIRLPILGVYASILVELGIILWGFRSVVREQVATASDPIAPTYGAIIRFFWPLALILMMQEFSRPLINLYIARQSNGTAALAVLAVVYILGRVPYGWLNDIRSLASAFREEPNSLYSIRRFVIGCTVVSLAMMFVCFWTPLRERILGDLVGLSPELVEMSRVPLYIYTAYTVAVTIRAYYQGIALAERRTPALAPSAPARLAAIWLSLLVLPFFGVMGATMGILALFNGFAIEAATVWWGVRGYRYFALLRKQPTVA
jgi:progressive ankylosis protein